MAVKIVNYPPNYGRQKVGRTPNPLGRHVGSRPSDLRGTGGANIVKVRRGRRG
jgi:hypothetical protein